MVWVMRCEVFGCGGVIRRVFVRCDGELVRLPRVEVVKIVEVEDGAVIKVADGRAGKGC